MLTVKTLNNDNVISIHNLHCNICQSYQVHISSLVCKFLLLPSFYNKEKHEVAHFVMLIILNVNRNSTKNCFKHMPYLCKVTHQIEISPSNMSHDFCNKNFLSYLVYSTRDSQEPESLTLFSFHLSRAITLTRNCPTSTQWRLLQVLSKGSFHQFFLLSIN